MPSGCIWRALVLIAFLPSRLAAGGFWLANAVIAPPSPATSDTITVAVSGLLPDPCYPTPTAAVSRMNTTVHIDVTANTTGGPCAAVIVGYAISVPIGGLPAGSYALAYSFTIDGRLSDQLSQPLTVSPGLPSGGLLFVPVTPCRVTDTRTGSGKSGAFGPPGIAAGASRDIPVASANCGVPETAQAYSLQITTVPAGPLPYLSLYPSGQAQPLVSTLNSDDGRIVANAAIVPAGVNGSVTLYAAGATDVIVDVNGYFLPPGAPGLSAMAFYVVTPCRVADTRAGSGKTGAFGPPAIAGGASRDIPILAGGCGIPATAEAYALNITAVPEGGLGYMTAWAAGQPRPPVSLLNDPRGDILANTAIVAAGTATANSTPGAISLFTTDTTDVIVDINGYFAPPGYPNALQFFPTTPCRGIDAPLYFLPPPVPQFVWPPIPGYTLSDPSIACAIPQTAAAYSVNVTVAPSGPLEYLVAWPGYTTQPPVSTLNALSGSVVANAALVGAGSGGRLGIWATAPTRLILDFNGYFLPYP